MTQGDRERLIARIGHERQAWRDLVAEVGRERMNEPGPMGDWTFKDLVSHLAGWRDRTLTRLDAAAHGREAPPAPWPADLDDDDSINGWIRERDRDRSLDDILTHYDRSFDRLAAVIMMFPEETIRTPGRFAWMGDVALADAPFFGHLHDEHEPAVREWLRRRAANA